MDLCRSVIVGMHELRPEICQEPHLENTIPEALLTFDFNINRL